jgi:hypothetical protein
MQECASLVRKLNQDKKDRENRLQEIQKRNEDKLNAEMEERMKIM